MEATWTLVRSEKMWLQQLNLEMWNLLETIIIVMAISIIFIYLNRQKWGGAVYVGNRVARFRFDSQEAKEQSIVSMYIFKYHSSPFWVVLVSYCIQNESLRCHILVSSQSEHISSLSHQYFMWKSYICCRKWKPISSLSFFFLAIKLLQFSVRVWGFSWLIFNRGILQEKKSTNHPPVWKKLITYEVQISYATNARGREHRVCQLCRGVPCHQSGLGKSFLCRRARDSTFGDSESAQGHWEPGRRGLSEKGSIGKRKKKVFLEGWFFQLADNLLGQQALFKMLQERTKKLESPLLCPSCW